jgi:hypothetical protein
MEQPNVLAQAKASLFAPGPVAEFNPDHFVNRNEEQALLERMVLPGGGARILAIEDVAECGKSMLLAQFEHNCRWRQPGSIAAARIPLDAVDVVDEFGIAHRIHLALQGQLQLETYEKSRLALENRDFGFFSMGASSFHAQIDLRGASVGGNAIISAFRFENSSGPGWNPEKEDWARRACVTAMSKDLRAHASQSPLVLMFDSFEKGSATAREFVMQVFLGMMRSGNPRAENLMLVFAGQSVPNLAVYFPQAHAQKVHTLPPMRKFTLEELREAFKKLELGSLDDNDIKFVYSNLVSGVWALGTSIGMGRLFNSLRVGNQGRQ